MSATRDKSQKTVFVYSNLYQLYRKGKEEAKASVPVSGDKSYFELPSEKNVLKTETLSQKLETSALNPMPEIRPYNPPELIGKRIPKAETALSTEPDAAIVSLKQNLQILNDLHSRLRFMLQELEELVKE